MSLNESCVKKIKIACILHTSILMLSFTYKSPRFWITFVDFSYQSFVNNKGKIKINNMIIVRVTWDMVPKNKALQLCILWPGSNYESQEVPKVTKSVSKIDSDPTCHYKCSLYLVKSSVEKYKALFRACPRAH